MNSLNLTMSENTTVVDLMADVDLAIVDNAEGGTQADVCDILQDVILARCAGRASLPAGKYNIRMLCVVTRNEDEHVEQTSGVSGNVADHNLPESNKAD